MAYTKDGGFIMDEYQITAKTLCIDCKHLKGSTKYGPTCSAFPNKIPSQIWVGTIDHNISYPGDHGIQYEEDEVNNELDIEDLELIDDEW